MSLTLKKILTPKRLATVLVFAVTFLFLAGAFQASINPASPASTQIHQSVISRPLGSSINTSSYSIASSTPQTVSNGTYDIGEVGNLHELNINTAEGFCDLFLLDEIYETPAVQLPNDTIIPWLASSYVQSNVTGKGITTFDPVTGENCTVNYIWTVSIRPDVKWTDINSSNANDTYIFSNETSFVSTCGVSYNYTYSSFYDTLTGNNQTWKPVKMKEYYLQAGDFILSWKLLFDSYDYSGEFQNIVNVVPVNNLTVEYYLSNVSATFVDCTMDTPPVIPYNVWVHHDYASTPSLWNYSSVLPASQAYNTWNIGYNPSTGTISGLVGDGPFMVNGGFGQPKGGWISGDYWQVYANPDFFAKYYPNLAQYSPKIYSIKDLFYAQYSSAVAAEAEGKIFSIVLPPPPSFVPTLTSIPDTYIYDKPSTGYNYIQLNSLPSNAPFNITAFRQALNYAVNKAYIASVIFEGYDVLGTSIVPVSDPLWHDSNVTSYNYDLTKAEALIASIPGMVNVSGVWYYNGKKVTASIQVASAAEDPSVVEAMNVISTEWDSIGIPTTVIEEASSTACANTEDYAYNAITCPITGVVGDPTGFFLELYNTLGNGTGLYLGPFTALNYNGVDYTGSQITGLMNNLTVRLDSITNLTQRLAISDEIQAIAADESTMINLGYPIKSIPITNSTFTGIVKDSLGIGEFWYWNFMSLHLRKVQISKVVNSKEEYLQVGVISNSQIYYDGQYGNITVMVRNQYGSPVSGANVTLGYSPPGALLNVSSYIGKTSLNGQYIFEFKVSSKNTLTYTADYMGSINFTASASINSINVVTGIGYEHFDVQPYPVAYSTGTMPVLSSNLQYFNITVYNPETGKPISGYGYTLQSLSGAVVLENTSQNQTVTSGTECDIGIPVNATCCDFNTTTVIGTTGANGFISVLIGANSTFNYTMNGQFYESYLFVGNYSSGSPVVGKPLYDSLGELTSSYNSLGSGVSQPFEIPVMITNNTGNSLNISVQLDHTIKYNGETTITVNVKNGSIPVPDYELTLTSQNVLGANRGYFVGGVGSAFNPNCFFGSTNMPTINVITNSSGVAQAVFNAGLYEPVINQNTGAVITYTGIPFTSSHLVPFDEFEIGIYGSNSSNDTFITSTPYAFNNTTEPFLYPVAAAYLQGENYINGVVSINSGQDYEMYVNTTYNNQAGPDFGSVPVVVSVNDGNLSATNGKTNGNGTLTLTYKSPNVQSTTEIVVTIEVNGSSGHTEFTYVFYDLPVHRTNVTLYNYTIGVLGVIAVVLAISFGLYAFRSRKKMNGSQKT